MARTKANDTFWKALFLQFPSRCHSPFPLPYLPLSAFCPLTVRREERFLRPFFRFRLKEESRWSPSFYAYLMALCTRAGLSDSDPWKDVSGLLESAVASVKKKANPVEAFILKRVRPPETP